MDPAQHQMPFGRHRGQPIAEIPSAYLHWLITGPVKLSTGLRAAVAAELSRRGASVPERQERPVPTPTCRRCPAAAYCVLWRQDRLGRKSLRAECCRCHQFLTTLPLREPFIAMADQA